MMRTFLGLIVFGSKAFQNFRWSRFLVVHPLYFNYAPLSQKFIHTLFFVAKFEFMQMKMKMKMKMKIYLWMHMKMQMKMI